MKLNTQELKTACSLVVNAAGMNPLLPITQMLGIRADGKNVTLSVRGTSSFFNIDIPAEGKDSFSIVIMVEQFTKLIGKFTKEFTTLVAEETFLSVSCNGQYKLEYIQDADKSFLEWSDYPPLPKKVDKVALKAGIISDVYKTHRTSVMATMERPAYTHVYLGNTALSTNDVLVVQTDLNIFDDHVVLLNLDVLNVLALAGGDLSLQISDNVVLFKGTKWEYYVEGYKDHDQFSYDTLVNFIDDDFPYCAKVSKAELLATLERISLFIGVYDSGKCNVTFGDSLLISSSTSSGVDSINFLTPPVVNTGGKKKVPSAMYNIPAPALKEAIIAVSGDEVALHYGNDTALKIVEGDKVALVSYLQDENNEF